MAHQFDELAKALAEGVSRREALRRLGGGLVAALLASLGLDKVWADTGPGGNSGCIAFCAQAFDSRTIQFANCVADGALGHGPCANCGADLSRLCPQGDLPVCCGPTQVCRNGQCDNRPCPPGQRVCQQTGSDELGKCVDLQTDLFNCGKCFNWCRDISSEERVVEPACCGGVCVDLLRDRSNCGRCGNVCTPKEECRGGVGCVAV
jgi:Stigma-specific protein, Stig1